MKIKKQIKTILLLVPVAFILNYGHSKEDPSPSVLEEV